jgi:CDP-4-dehydro-6-deoxyglucose reductase
MSHTVTIKPSNHVFHVHEGETLLDAALRENLKLPYGCRSGACGVCKGKILDGRVDFGNPQPSALSEEDRANGLALFCCAKPLGDLVIEGKEIGAAREIPVRTLPCRVERMQRLAEDVMELQLKLPANERLQFLAGQYVDILMKDGRRRSFSIACAPEDDTLLQLHIRHLPGGAFTEYVFNHMREKDILRIEGPHGNFYLREESDRPIILLASGTGFAPIKAMLEHAFHTGMKRPMTLYWGARQAKDLYMMALPQRWQAEHAHFKFVPVLSEARPEDVWTGRTGLVHQAVLEDTGELSGHQVYACGAPQMVAAAQKAFVGEHGLPEGEFFSDAFFVAGAGK